MLVNSSFTSILGFPAVIINQFQIAHRYLLLLKCLPSLLTFLLAYSPLLASESLSPASSLPNQPPRHWSLTPPTRPPLPDIKNQQWIRNPIDHFILAQLEKESVLPSPEADPRTLIRRLSLDLLGLPPTPEAAAAFAADPSPQSWDKLVDQFLASPHFGERWGRHWLDLARYADSDGYEKDSARPYAYLYRDWVIDAVNRDLPFDQFSIQQLAGDLLPNADLPQKIATGFHRNTLTNKEGGVDQEEYRCKATVDRVSTTATVWLGLTAGCAECHNHKYDPISQREFFQLYAFFDSTAESDLPAPQPAELAEYSQQLAAWQKEHATLKSQRDQYIVSSLHLNQTIWESRLNDSIDSFAGLKLFTPVAAFTPKLLPGPIASTLSKPPAIRSASDSQQLRDYYRNHIDPTALKLDRALADHKRAEPLFPPTKAQTLAQSSPPRTTHIHIRGDFLRKGDPVQPATPAILHPFKPQSNPPNRLDLAHWLFHPDNPLTARVAVNQVWQHLFGRGLVATPDDFGARGENPSHPELLDWLATEFQQLNWSRKSLIRLIVTSATYRQASHHRPDLADRDPNNNWLARQNRFRLDSEIVRDAFLTSSGLIASSIGGPSIRPPLPADIAALGYASSIKWKESNQSDRFRRGLYIFFQRTVPYPMLMMFDSPDSNSSCTRREKSNTPLQALTLLNDPVFFECAQALAVRLTTSHHHTPIRDQISRAFELCLARPPTPDELSRLENLYHAYASSLASQPEQAAQIAGSIPSSPSNLLHRAALVGVSRTILNLDEFVTRE